MADFLTIASGFAVSSALALARGDLGLTLVFPASCQAADYRVQCATSSGAAAAGDAFGDWLANQNFASGLTPFTVFSGGGLATPAYVTLPYPPATQFVRLKSSASQTVTSTFTVMPYRVPT